MFCILPDYPTNANSLIALIEKRIREKQIVVLHDYKKEDGSVETWQSFIKNQFRSFIKDTGCIEWSETTGKYQYGLVQRPWRFISQQSSGATYLHAHRLIWSAINQVNLVDLNPFVVRHLCGNHSCCQPAHLAIGTYYENTRDRKLHDLSIPLAPAI